MREYPDKDLGLHNGTTSYFGYRQLPWTIEYLKAAKRFDLETCAGGGVVSKKDVDTLLSLGADMVQTASYVLCRDFTAVQDLLEPTLWSCNHSEILKHNPWCDYKDGEPCEKCGACTLHKTSMQATNTESSISACMGGLI